MVKVITDSRMTYLVGFIITEWWQILERVRVCVCVCVNHLLFFFLCHRLINYLRMSYGSFSGVIRNSVQLARLIQYQEQCQENEKAVAAGEEGNTGTNVETVPLRCDLTCILWAEMQVCDHNNVIH